MSRENIDIKALKRDLLDSKAELERLSLISLQSRAPVELDQTTQGRLSRQDALLQQEMAKETERRPQKDLERIKAALLRVDTDDYGYCISCDEEISAARLKLDPAITTCIDCAK